VTAEALIVAFGSGGGVIDVLSAKISARAGIDRIAPS
jgi:hypothetical protein